MSEEYTTVFPPYYEGAEMSRGNAGWENPPYYLTAYGLAVKHGYTGTEEEWLASLKGDPGPGIVIWGHYDTLAELEEDVTDPEDGEMYDVGSGAAQLVYYWSGDEWLPLNVHGPQGETGPAGADGAPGVDGADGASAYEQAVDAGYSGTEQEFMALLADLPGYTEQARLWAVAAGEAESAAEGYAEAAAESAASIDMTNYVPKTRTVNGKALSSDITVAAADVPYSNVIGGMPVADVDAALDGLVTYSVPNTRRINDTRLNDDLVLFWGGSITLSLSWSGSGPYTQTGMEITSLSWTDGITSKSRISLQPTAAQLAQLISDGVVALTIENNNGTLTAYAIGAAPTTAMTIACTVMEVKT